ncbi:MAG: hypothetical protein J5849_06805 [Clostridia bacterium]|nr:hypothetical protein [Clostridia bacterium]
MIDAENAIFARVREKILERFPETAVLNGGPETPEALPAVVLTEEDNASYARSLDGEGKEHHARVTYALDVFTDALNGGKTLAKAIAGAADGVLCGLRFTRLSFSPAEIGERGVVRFSGRYRAVVAAPKEEGVDGEGRPRLIYTIYRK